MYNLSKEQVEVLKVQSAFVLKGLRGFIIEQKDRRLYHRAKSLKHKLDLRLGPKSGLRLELKLGAKMGEKVIDK